MSNHLWAEVDALNIAVLRQFEDGQPHAPRDVRLDGQSADMVDFALRELTSLGYLKPTWSGSYRITTDGQAHLAAAKVG